MNIKTNDILKVSDIKQPSFNEKGKALFTNLRNNESVILKIHNPLKEGIKLKVDLYLHKIFFNYMDNSNKYLELV